MVLPSLICVWAVGALALWSWVVVGGQLTTPPPTPLCLEDHGGQ